MIQILIFIVSQTCERVKLTPDIVTLPHQFSNPPPFLGEKYCKEKLIPDHGFTGMSRNSPEAKAALGGGPTSPPLVWLMVGGSVWADNG